MKKLIFFAIATLVTLPVIAGVVDTNDIISAPAGTNVTATNSNFNRSVAGDILTIKTKDATIKDATPDPTLEISCRSKSGVEKDGLMNLVAGAQAEFDISILGLNNAVTINSFQYSLGTLQGLVKYTHDGNTITSISPVVLTVPNEPGSKSFSASVNYSNGDNQDILDGNYPVHIWATPSVLLKGAENVIISGSTAGLGWEIATSGGYDGGWDITWTFEGNQTKGKSFSMPEIENDSDNPLNLEVEVTVVNYAPDGKTVWYNESKRLSIKVLHSVVNVYGNSEDGPITEGILNRYTGQKTQFKIEVSGIAGVSSIKSFEYTFGPLSGTVDYTLINGQFISIAPVTLTVPKASGEIEFSTTLVYNNGYSEQTISNQVPVRVWPTPSAILARNPEEVVISGSTVGLGWDIEKAGGYDGGWDITWTFGDNQTKGMSFSMPEIENDSDNPLNLEVDVAAVNYAPDGKTVWYSLDKKIRITVVHDYINISCSIAGGVIESEINLLADQKAQFVIEPMGINQISSVVAFNYDCGDSTNNEVDYVIKDGAFSTITPVAILMPSPVESESFSVTLEYNNGYSLRTLTKEINVVVWPSIEVAVTGNELEETITGIVEDVSWNVEKVGGYPDGWEIIWTYDGKNYTTDSFELPTYINKTDKTEILTIDLKVSNKYPTNATKFYSDHKIIKVNVLPGPSVELMTPSFLGYNGTDITAELNVMNVYEDSQWYFDWTFNGNTETTQTPSYTVTLPETSEAAPFVGTMNVVARNIVDGKDRFVRNNIHNINITSCTYGRATIVAPDSLNVYSDHPINLSINKYGGYEKGWTYLWKDNGVVIGPTNDTFRQFVFNNKNIDPELHAISVVVKNSIGSQTGYEQELFFNNITSWSTCIFPEDFELTDINQGENSPTFQIREGNEFRLSLSGMEGGYSSSNNAYGWKANWDFAGSSYSGSPLLTATMTGSGAQMGTQIRDINVDLVNIGPDNNIWDSRSYTKNLTIYRKPSTPSDLMVKGDGKSKTFVVMMPLSDELLEEYDYYLVFGYTDKSGNIHISEPLRQYENNCRYAHFSEPVNSVNYFVYSLWNYPEGAKITSGRRFFDETEGTWDDSTYPSDNRSKIIADFECYTDFDDILSEDSETAEKSTRYYDLNGAEVTGNVLVPGIYLKATIVNGNRVITKILVK